MIMLEARTSEALHQERILSLVPCLLVFAGLPAAGKSSLSAELSAKTNAQLLDIDEIRSGLFPQTSCDVINLDREKLQMFEAYQKMYQLAASNLLRGTPIILSATFSSEKSHKEIARIARELGVPLKVFSLCAPIDVLAVRLLIRGQLANNYSNVTSRAHLQEVSGRFVKIAGENVVELDTTQPKDSCLWQITEALKSFRAVVI